MGEPSAVFAHSPSNDSKPVSYSVSLSGKDADGGVSLSLGYAGVARIEFVPFAKVCFDDEGILCLAFCETLRDLGDRTGVSISPPDEILSQAVWKDSAREEEDR